MLRPVAFALAVCLASSALVAAQDAPPSPRGGGGPGGAVLPEGGGEGGMGAGGATRVPELLARTPAVARGSELLGVEILDESSKPIAHLDDLVLAGDGRLVAILARPDGRLIGLPLDELIARAKPEPAGGSERVTISSFKLSRESRSLVAAPTIEDKAKLDAAWVTRLEGGNPVAAQSADKTDKAEKSENSDAADASSAPDAAAQGAPSSSETGAADGSRGSQPLPMLTAVLGRVALDRSGQPLGTIVDVIVAVSKGQVAYLVVRAGTDPAAPGDAGGADAMHGAPEALYAVAATALAPGNTDAGVRLVLDSQDLLLSPRLQGLTRLPVDPLAKSEPAATPR